MSKQYLDFAKDMAREAGKIMRKNFSLGMKRDWKGDGTPLTVTDLAVNALVTSSVSKIFPSHSLISEEGGYIRDSEYTWVCDPLDGTIPFSHSVPTSAFSLALTKNGESLVGAVYDPFLDRLVYAGKGSGAFLGKKRIAVSKQGLNRGVVDFEDFKDSLYPVHFVRRKLVDLGALVCQFHSIVYGGLLVACGELVTALYVGKHSWDGAALSVIVEEAGGTMTDLFGLRQRYDGKLRGFVISNGIVHDEILQLIKPTLEPV